MEQAKTQEKSAVIAELLAKLAKSIKNNRVVAGFVLTAIASVIGYAWKNADPPFVKAQIETIQTTITKHILSENAKDSVRDYNAALAKINQENTSKVVNEMSSQQKSDHDILTEIKTIIKQVNKNTKEKW